jgi:hypothetical protein
MFTFAPNDDGTLLLEDDGGALGAACAQDHVWTALAPGEMWVYYLLWGAQMLDIAVAQLALGALPPRIETALSRDYDGVR